MASDVSAIRTFVVTLGILALAVLVPATIVGQWATTGLSDASGYSARMAAAWENPQLRAEVEQQIVINAVAQLPQVDGGLGGILVQRAEGLIADGASRAVASPGFVTGWAAAHEAAFDSLAEAAADGDDSSPVTGSGQLRLDVTTLLAPFLGTELAATLARITDEAGVSVSVPLGTSGQSLVEGWSFLQFLADNTMTLLILVGVVLLAVLLVAVRRRGALMWSGIGATVGCLATVGGLAVAGGAAASGSDAPELTRAVLTAFADGLVPMLLVGAAAGMAVALFAGLLSRLRAGGGSPAASG